MLQLTQFPMLLSAGAIVFLVLQGKKNPGTDTAAVHQILLKVAEAQPISVDRCSRIVNRAMFFALLFGAIRCGNSLQGIMTCAIFLLPAGTLFSNWWLQLIQLKKLTLCSCHTRSTPSGEWVLGMNFMRYVTYLLPLRPLSAAKPLFSLCPGHQLSNPERQPSGWPSYFPGRLLELPEHGSVLLVGVHIYVLKLSVVPLPQIV